MPGNLTRSLGHTFRTQHSNQVAKIIIRISSSKIERSIAVIALACTLVSAGATVQASLLVYEGFNYETASATRAGADLLQGQPTDPGGTDTDAVGLGGVWQMEAVGSLPSASSDVFLKQGSLAFGDLMTSGNHVGSDTNQNQNVYSRQITATLDAGDGFWLSFLAEKPQNNFNQAREGIAITNQSVSDPRLNENSGSNLMGFGVAPTDAGNNWTAYAWDGTNIIQGSNSLPVTIGQGDVRLLVGHVSYDTGTNGADVFTLYEYQLSPDDSIFGGNLSLITAIEADVDQSLLDTLLLTRRVNTNFDEIRIGTTLQSVLPVPEPTRALLLSAGVALLLFRRRR